VRAATGGLDDHRGLPRRVPCVPHDDRPRVVLRQRSDEDVRASVAHDVGDPSLEPEDVVDPRLRPQEHAEPLGPEAGPEEEEPLPGVLHAAAVLARSADEEVRAAVAVDVPRVDRHAEAGGVAASRGRVLDREDPLGRERPLVGEGAEQHVALAREPEPGAVAVAQRGDEGVGRAVAVRVPRREDVAEVSVLAGAERVVDAPALAARGGEDEDRAGGLSSDRGLRGTGDHVRPAVAVEVGHGDARAEASGSPGVTRADRNGAVEVLPRRDDPEPPRVLRAPDRRVGSADEDLVPRVLVERPGGDRLAEVVLRAGARTGEAPRLGEVGAEEDVERPLPRRGGGDVARTVAVEVEGHHRVAELRVLDRRRMGEEAARGGGGRALRPAFLGAGECRERERGGEREGEGGRHGSMGRGASSNRGRSRAFRGVRTLFPRARSRPRAGGGREGRAAVTGRVRQGITSASLPGWPSRLEEGAASLRGRRKPSAPRGLRALSLDPRGGAPTLRAPRAGEACP